MGDPVLNSAMRLPLAFVRSLESAVSAVAIGQPPWLPGIVHALDEATRERLGDDAGEAYRAGTELMRSTAAPALAGARGALRGGVQVLRSSVGLMGPLTPLPGWRTELVELGNKLAAFEHFRFARSILGTGRADGNGLAGRVAALAGLDRYLALWVHEGLGYDYAERARQRDGSPPETLLTDPKLDDLPGWCWLPLHTGMALSLAGHLLAEADLARADERVDRLLRRYWRLCESNSRPGFAPLVFEALGFVCGNVHPHLLSRLDRRLERLEPDYVPVLWNGVGRGMYFAPTRMLPCTPGSLIDRVRHEVPHEAGRRAAVSGLAWALTLVNFRSPAVLELFVERHGGGIPAWARQPFADGVTAGVRIWHAVHGRDSYLRAWTGHQPETLRGDLPALWRRLILRPARTAVDSAGTIDEIGLGRSLLFHDAMDDDRGPSGNAAEGANR